MYAHEFVGKVEERWKKMRWSGMGKDTFVGLFARTRRPLEDLLLGLVHGVPVQMNSQYESPGTCMQGMW